MDRNAIKEDLEIFRHQSGLLNNKLKSLLPSENRNEFNVLTIFYRSEIRNGDYKLLEKFMREAQIPKGKGLVVLNGPGGDTIEAIKMGILLRAHFYQDLKIVIPRIAGSAMVYLSLFGNEIIIPPKNTYLTTVNNTVVSKKNEDCHRLIPNSIIGSPDKEGQSVAICNKTSLEIYKILNKEETSSRLYDKLNKIKSKLNKIMWKIIELSNDTTGDLVENLLFEERRLQHEFLDKQNLVENKFPISNGRFSINFFKILAEIYNKSSIHMDDHHIFYQIQYESKIACKYV